MFGKNMLSCEATRAAEVIDISKGLSLHDLALSAPFHNETDESILFRALIELSAGGLIRWTRETNYGKEEGTEGRDIAHDIAWIQDVGFYPKGELHSPIQTLFIEPREELKSLLEEGISRYGSVLK